MTIRETMELLSVSESTVRRLFLRLEKEGRLIRTFGGVRSIAPAITQYRFDYGVVSNIEKKRAVARTAVRFVDDGDVIFCDSGSTVRCFCEELRARIAQEQMNVRFYTNSLSNLEILSDVAEVTLIGGKYRPNRQDFSGFIADEALAKLYFNKVFIGADGCFETSAFSTTDAETAHMNQIAIRNAAKTYMLVDSTKFRRASHIIYTPVSSLHAVITDEGLEAAFREKLEAFSVGLILAPLGEAEQGKNK